MNKLGFVFGLSVLALSVTACATDGASDPQHDTVAQRLLGTWVGDYNGAPTQFSFVDDGSVIETLMDDSSRYEGTFDLVDSSLTLDFGGGDPATFQIAFTQDGSLELDGTTFQQLSGCGGAPESD